MLDKKSITRGSLFLGLLLNVLVIIVFILLYRAYLVPTQTSAYYTTFEESAVDLTNPVE